jgi:pimeloyl-ACP methyl ester carboxylesterase
VALEPRFRAAVFVVAGLSMSRARPEADPVNFLPRVRVPSLMMNGTYDHYFPPETSQQPFFRLLGAPAADKRYVLHEGGHSLPRTLVIAESLGWLDKYLGPVAR